MIQIEVADLEQADSAICFVCPSCQGELGFSEAAYACSNCMQEYPVLFGIPDFRLRSDRYLTIEQEREKAGLLHQFARTASFDDLVAYYYSITPDVPPALALRYQAYIRNAPNQARDTVARLDPDPGKDAILDLGCGAGGLLVEASGHFRQVVGVDIALRWLVICKKRLDELGIDATLVCADAEQLPFKDGAYTHVVAGDLVEHVYDVNQTIKACWNQLRPGGRFWLSATNRYCIGPHPLTRIWGIGFLPRAARSKILLKLRGVDSLRHTNLVSPAAIKRLCKQAGFRLLSTGPRQLNTGDIAAYPRQDRVLLRIYGFLLQFRLFRKVLVIAGPAFEMMHEK